MTLNKSLNKNKTFYTVFKGVLTKRGKSINSKKILDKTFDVVSKTTGLSLQNVFLKIILLLNSFVEVKRLRSRRSSHFVPFPISFKRKLYLICCWLIASAKIDNRKISFSEKLSKEIIDLISGKTSKSFIFKNLNYTNAISNKSNIHYRW